MTEWKFARRRDRCTACDAPFEDGARHVSSLCVRGEDLAREDVCVACWERGPESRGGGQEGGREILFWFTKKKGGSTGLRLDLPTLEELFVRLEGREEGKVLELRYVLCLLLMRKRRLKLVRVARDPRETMLVRRPRREEAFAVAVCDFGPDRIEGLKQELAEIFDGAEAWTAGPQADGGVEEVPPARVSSPCGVE